MLGSHLGPWTRLSSTNELSCRLGYQAGRITLLILRLAYLLRRLYLLGKMDEMAEWAGKMVGLIGFVADQLAQKVDYNGL